MKIKSIEITNVKGIKSENFTLDLNANKPNILVAPNGFGKSSFAIAFDSLKRVKIDLDSKHYHMNVESNRPSISMQIDACGTSWTLIANDTQNTISEEFDIFVINSQLMAKAIKLSFSGKTIVKPSLEITPIILVPTIPTKKLFNYSPSETKTAFGINGKILPNITSVFSCAHILTDILNNVDLNKFVQVKLSKKLEVLKADINAQIGTSDSIKQWIEINKLIEMQEIEDFNKLAIIIRKLDGIKNDIDSFLAAFQVIEVYKTMRTDFRKAINYTCYLDDKDFYEKTIDNYNTTRHIIRPKEDKIHNCLTVEWPKAHEISNGQRDVLSFITMLMKAKRNFRKQNCILIIDEIFDYLDDANLISFQYFITNMIEEMKEKGKNFFPILMTHLDPMYFNHFCFNKHRIKVVYLKNVSIHSNPNILSFIRKRADPTIQIITDQYYFHFHPNQINIIDKFSALGLPPAWGESHRFHQFIENEVNKYLDNQTDFDPLAICFGVRYQIEKLLYSKITNPTNQQRFIDEHGTKNKLDFCIEIGMDVPEIYFLLGIIYNDNLHIRNGQDFTKPVAIKLENLTIKKMIREIYN